MAMTGINKFPHIHQPDPKTEPAQALARGPRRLSSKIPGVIHHRSRCSSTSTPRRLAPCLSTWTRASIACHPVTCARGMGERDTAASREGSAGDVVPGASVDCHGDTSEKKPPSGNRIQMQEEIPTDDGLSKYDTYWRRLLTPPNCRWNMISPPAFTTGLCVNSLNIAPRSLPPSHGSRGRRPNLQRQAVRRSGH